MADREVIVTPYGRLSFPDLVKPRVFNEGEQPKYNAALLFPKPGTEGEDREDGTAVSPWRDAAKHDLSHLRKVIGDFVAATWPDPKKRPKGLKLPFLDGDEKEWDGYAGHFFIRTTSVRPPKLIDARKAEITGDEIEKVFYPGCWVRAIINPFDYNAKGNKGVSFGLQALQFVRDDVPFTGGINAQEAFDDLPEDDIAPDDLDDLE